MHGDSPTLFDLYSFFHCILNQIPKVLAVLSSAGLQESCAHHRPPSSPPSQEFNVLRWERPTGAAGHSSSLLGMLQDLADIPHETDFPRARSQVVSRAVA